MASTLSGAARGAMETQDARDLKELAPRDFELEKILFNEKRTIRLQS